ncbi:snake venom 5'-nucleotidase-like [Littorina saxatilis]|uniref:5'-nucleotidase n=1 Tax=Littorina saxatilis TaxID=31220 RepID=A0AAN9BN82_9CAEN
MPPFAMLMMMMMMIVMKMTMTLPGCFAGEFTLTILHTNDVHAHYEEFNQFDQACDSSKGEKCFGGYARIVSKVKSLRKLNKNTLFLDGGDQYQGTPYFYKYGGNITSHFMNWAGYDVMALGNHEFDRGIAGLVSFLKAVNFNVVSANIDTSLEPDVTGLIKETVEWTFAGRKVGIIGYTTEDAPRISYPQPLTFRSVRRSVERLTETLQANATDIIIAVGHAGFTVDKQVANIPGVNVVIGGHSNTFLYTGTPPSSDIPADKYPVVVSQKFGGEALVVQCYYQGKYLCLLNVTFNDAGDVIRYDGSPILLDDSVEQDKATLEELKQWKQGLGDLMKTVVGRTLVKLDGNRMVCRTRECNLGNLITDAMAEEGRKFPSRTGANFTIAIYNSGGIRSSFDIGSITFADLISALPFNENFDRIYLKGKFLYDALRRSASTLDPCNKNDSKGHFLQFSGLRVKYNLNRPEVVRVVSAEVKDDNDQYQPLKQETVYRVMMGTFLIKGNEGFTAISDNILRRDHMDWSIVDVLADYLKAKSPIDQKVEGRIQFVGGSDVCKPRTSRATRARPTLLVLSLSFVATAFLGQQSSPSL